MREVILSILRRLMRIDALCLKVDDLTELIRHVHIKENQTEVCVQKQRYQLAEIEARIQSIPAPQVLYGNFERVSGEVERVGARIEAIMGEIQSGNISLLASVSEAYAMLSREMETIRSELLLLQRTAPGRGNVALPGNRMLTRLSLPGHFPNSDPIYFVNADDKLIVPKLAMSGYYEREATEFVARTIKPMDPIVDVGANFGYYTVIFAVLVGWKGKVVAFEPESRMYDLLIENLTINWVESWSRAVKAACADQPGQLRFYTSQARAANTGPTVPQIGAEFGPDFAFTPIDVTAVRIDDSLDFLDGRVDFMKIDVEGGEPLVLRGAAKTIAANPQIRIMMEWSAEQLRAAGHDLAAFALELEAYGLDCQVIARGGACEPLEFVALPSLSYSNIVLARRS